MGNGGDHVSKAVTVFHPVQTALPGVGSCDRLYRLATGSAVAWHKSAGIGGRIGLGVVFWLIVCWGSGHRGLGPGSLGNAAWQTDGGGRPMTRRITC